MAALMLPEIPEPSRNGKADIPELPAAPIRGGEERETGTGWRWTCSLHAEHNEALT
jgi:hypothetical protein